MAEGRLWSTYYGALGRAYLSRVHLGARTKLHVFHRGDADPDPHDHPWEFWTFPLTGYYEQVWEPDRQQVAYVPHVRYVAPWRRHWRPATYMHRVLGRRPDGTGGKVVTLVRMGSAHRDWGFWVADRAARYGRRWVQWQKYLGLQ